MKRLYDMMKENEHKRPIRVNSLFDCAEALVVDKSEREGIEGIDAKSEAYYLMDIYKGDKCLRIEYERASGNLSLRVYTGKKVFLGKRPNMDKGLYKVLDLYINNVNESHRNISKINLYIPSDTSNKKDGWEDILIEKGKDLPVPIYIPSSEMEKILKELRRQRPPLSRY